MKDGGGGGGVERWERNVDKRQQKRNYRNKRHRKNGDRRKKKDKRHVRTNVIESLF